MSYASRSGRASTSSVRPQAFAVCDRCALWFNRVNLTNQMAYRGAALMPTNMYVCNACYDRPNAQNRAITLPADPVPIMQPRTEPFLYDATEDQTVPYGEPVGLEPYAVSPMGVDPVTGVYRAYGVDVQPLSVISNGTTAVAVTCRAAHGLVTNDQVAASGLANKLADGFFSVSVSGAMSFSYTTFSVVPTGSLLAAHSRIVTVLIGLPRGSTTITQVG